jgi:hypothetical protein
MGNARAPLFVAGELGLAGLGHFAPLHVPHSRHVVARSGFFIAKAGGCRPNVALPANKDLGDEPIGTCAYHYSCVFV